MINWIPHVNHPFLWTLLCALWTSVPVVSNKHRFRFFLYSPPLWFVRLQSRLAEQREQIASNFCNVTAQKACLWGQNFSLYFVELSSKKTWFSWEFINKEKKEQHNIFCFPSVERGSAPRQTSTANYPWKTDTLQAVPLSLCCPCWHPPCFMWIKYTKSLQIQANLLSRLSWDRS